MNGYHSIIGDHSLVSLDRKTRRRFINKGKTPILNVVADLINDYYMQNEVSYKQYAREWNWEFRDIKELFLHLGIKITTKEKIKHKSVIEITQPIQSKKYPESILGLVKKYFAPEVAPEVHQKANQKDGQKTDTCEIFTPEVAPEVHQKLHHKRNKRIDKRNKRINNNIILNSFANAKEHISRDKLSFNNKTPSLFNLNYTTEVNCKDIINNSNGNAKKEKNKKIKEFAEKVIDYLNKKIGTRYKATTQKTLSLINARLQEGFELQDFYQVIDNMVDEWGCDIKMAKYLRPQTLFSSNFESYLNIKNAKRVAITSPLTRFDKDNIEVGLHWLQKQKQKESQNVK